MINVAKWALLALLALPFLELAAFVAVAAMIGFGWALSLVLAGSARRFAHIAPRRRQSYCAHARRLGQGQFHRAGRRTRRAVAILIAGILLLIPGFITDLGALCLLVPPLRRALSDAVSAMLSRQSETTVSSILPPEQWHQVPDPSLAGPAARHTMIPQSEVRPRHSRSDVDMPRSCGRKTIPSLFPSWPYVSQPPRKQVWCKGVFMTTTNGGPAPAAAQDMQPQLTVVSQYIKDFSFENPNAPQSLTEPSGTAADRNSDQCRRQPAVGDRHRSGDQARRQGRSRRRLYCSVSNWNLPACFAFATSRRKA